MSYIPNDQVGETIRETLVWADDVAEMWTGTIHESVIHMQKARLVKAVEENDLELAQSHVADLAQTLEFAEKEYNKVA